MKIKAELSKLSGNMEHQSTVSLRSEADVLISWWDSNNGPTSLRLKGPWALEAAEISLRNSKKSGSQPGGVGMSGPSTRRTKP